ncbi:unnamed protein product [Strongylus vulgaris]|uniref:Uncharacterized protein n=1 Tax=Strongylus vulgaris TaxID=40348 RepID=A0A3P7J231_STRVU|nr:unnamed protein product [Strongylus vulgaris]
MHYRDLSIINFEEDSKEEKIQLSGNFVRTLIDDDDGGDGGAIGATRARIGAGNPGKPNGCIRTNFVSKEMIIQLSGNSVRSFNIDDDDPGKVAETLATASSIVEAIGFLAGRPRIIYAIANTVVIVNMHK